MRESMQNSVDNHPPITSFYYFVDSPVSVKQYKPRMKVPSNKRAQESSNGKETFPYYDEWVSAFFMFGEKPSLHYRLLFTLGSFEHRVHSA